MNRQRYPTDLTDEEFTAIVPLLPKPKTGGRTGRPSQYTDREILNGILYQRQYQCPWRQLPSDLPHWNSVYAHWLRWKRDGTLERIVSRLETIRDSPGNSQATEKVFAVVREAPQSSQAIVHTGRAVRKKDPMHKMDPG